MRLQDEYIKRHNLNFKPIYHTKHANLILKYTRPKIILTIRWDDTTRSPGYYVFRYFQPNHNGYLDGNYFLQLNDNYYYQYDEYHTFLTKWAKNLELEPIKFEQINLAIWEMFLYCFDGWIAERNLEEMAFQATNPFLPIEGRMEAISEFLKYLEKHDSLIFEIYNSEFRKYEYNYAAWLVELIDYSKKNFGEG